MKILAEYGTQKEKVYIINTFNSVSSNIYAPVQVCTILHDNGDLENVPFSVVKVIDKTFLTIKGE